MARGWRGNRGPGGQGGQGGPGNQGLVDSLKKRVVELEDKLKKAQLKKCSFCKGGGFELDAGGKVIVDRNKRLIPCRVCKGHGYNLIGG